MAYWGAAGPIELVQQVGDKDLPLQWWQEEAKPPVRSQYILGIGKGGQSVASKDLEPGLLYELGQIDNNLGILLL